MKKLFLMLTMLFFLIGCGGGGGGGSSSTDGLPVTSIPTSEDTSIPITKNTTLTVSSNILKTSYLPSFGLSAPLTYTVDTDGTEGNVTLLDPTLGRFTYFTSQNAGSDTFTYIVEDAQGEAIGVKVILERTNVPVTLNGTVENNFSSNLPLVIVDTGDQPIPDEPKIKGSMALIEPDGTGRSRLDLPPSYSGYMEIEVRGSSSQFYYPKKQYSVDTETWDEDDDDVSLLGMPAEHKWILQAPYGDKSLMRNYLAHHKTREIDETKYYAVRSHFVELLKREGDHYSYEGVYVLMEKIKRDKNRLDITKLRSSDNVPPEVSGGYIFKQDGDPDPDEDTFAGITGTLFIYVDPKSSKITNDQKYYIENYVQEFELALNASDFNNTTSPNYYGNYISEEDFIVHILSREFFMDVDTWLFSEYLHKDRNATLALSTVWDFNLGMGNNNINDGYQLNGTTSGWVYDLYRNDFRDYALRKWVDRLMSDPAFRTKLKAKWQMLRTSIWSDANLTTFIDNTKVLLTEAADRNFQRWPDVLGQYVWPNRKACDDNGTAVYCPTFNRAVDEGLKTWVIDRAHWLDANLSN